MALIRRAEAGDSATLLPLVAAYWDFESISGFDPALVAPQLERLLSTPSLGVGWIALADNVAVGYLLAVYVFSLEHMGLTAEIDEFFVLPMWRGLGIAPHGGERFWTDWLQTTLQPDCMRLFRGFYRTPAGQRNSTQIQAAQKQCDRHFRLLDERPAYRKHVMVPFDELRGRLEY